MGIEATRAPIPTTQVSAGFDAFEDVEDVRQLVMDRSERAESFYPALMNFIGLNTRLREEPGYRDAFCYAYVDAIEHVQDEEQARFELTVFKEYVIPLIGGMALSAMCMAPFAIGGFTSMRPRGTTESKGVSMLAGRNTPDISPDEAQRRSGQLPKHSAVEETHVDRLDRLRNARSVDSIEWDVFASEIGWPGSGNELARVVILEPVEMEYVDEPPNTHAVLGFANDVKTAKVLGEWTAVVASADGGVVAAWINKVWRFEFERCNDGTYGYTLRKIGEPEKDSVRDLLRGDQVDWGQIKKDFRHAGISFGVGKPMS